MPDLPIDTSNPEVRDYLSLIRLQMLTPLSLLINIAVVGVCSFILSPSMGKVSKMYPTSITPSPSMISIYVSAVYIGQIGYCALLALAHKTETKDALIKGTGLALVFANWVMAFFALAWTFRMFTTASVLLGILVLLLIFSNIVLVVYHPTTRKRPLDTALIHAPLRLFLILPMTIMLPQAIFIAIGHHWTEGSTKDYDAYKWEGFGVLLAMNLVGLLFIALRRDFIWTVGASWIAAAVWTQAPKSAPVSTIAILFVFLHPTVLLLSTFWVHIAGKRRQRHGVIVLPPDDAEDGGGHTGNGQNELAREREASHPDNRTQSAGRVWG